MNLKPLFYPRSIAVIGASSQVGSVGNDLVKNLVKQGFEGDIFPVNPKKGQLYGLKVRSSLAEITAPIDLVVVAVPAKIVPQILREAGAKKIKAAIVISAGFKESGHSELEAEVAQIARDHDLALIGPNCLGLIHAQQKLNASFAPLMPAAGEIAFISQSGAICASVLDYARERSLGFSKFVSVGNKAVIGELELLRYLYTDPETKVILLYVEQLTQIPELITVAQEITQHHTPKPIIILKSGRTAAGSQASQSHTGALSGSDTAYDALFAQTGIIRAESISELFDFAECFVHNRQLKNNRVAILTNAGGPGVLTTDALMTDELKLAKLSPETESKLRAFLPAAASVKNPIDILGDANADRYEQALKLLLADPAIDGVIVILTPQSMTEVEATARAIARLKKLSKKPLVVSFMGQKLVESGLKILHQERVATTMFPEPAAKVFGALNTFREWLKPANRHTFRFRNVHPERVDRWLKKYTPDQPRLLSPDLTRSLLKAYGLPVLQRQVVTSLVEAEAVAKRIDAPLVLKIVSPDISHKTDAGGVKLNVAPNKIRAAYQELLMTVKARRPFAQITGVEIMELVTKPGLEIILGVTTDPQVGKLILVGLGGIYTEALQDTAWGVAPLTHSDAERMVDSLKAAQILAGARGQTPLDREDLIACLGRLSQLITRFPQIKEIDINPLKVLAKGQGSVILDARVILELGS